MTEIERPKPKKCPFLLNYHRKYGEDKNKSEWNCTVERCGLDEDLVTEICVTGYQKCEMFSKGIHYRDIPKTCPCIVEDFSNDVCSLATGLGRGCGYREQYEYLECARFSKWFYEHRKEMMG